MYQEAKWMSKAAHPLLQGSAKFFWQWGSVIEKFAIASTLLGLSQINHEETFRSAGRCWMSGVTQLRDAT